MVKNMTNWIPHPFYFMNTERQFRVLAESNHMYQVIELGFIVGCMYELNLKDISHIEIIKNFTLRATNEVRNNNYTTRSLLEVLSLQKRKKAILQDDAWKELYEVHNKQIQEAIKKGEDISSLKRMTFDLDIFKHSGMTFRKEQTIKTVNENSINRQTSDNNVEVNLGYAFIQDADKEVIQRNSTVYKSKIKSIYRSIFPKSRSQSRDASGSRKNIKLHQKMEQIENSVNVRDIVTDNDTTKTVLQERTSELPTIKLNDRSPKSPQSAQKVTMGPPIGPRRRYKTIDKEYALRGRQFQVSYSPVQKRVQVLDQSSDSLIMKKPSYLDLSTKLNAPEIVCLIKLKQNNYSNVPSKVRTGMIRPAANMAQRSNLSDVYGGSARISFIETDNKNDNGLNFYMKKTKLRRTTEEESKMRSKSFRF